MTYSLTIDPGLSTGIVLAHYTDTEPWRRVAFWQVEGGVDGFDEWWREHGEHFTLGDHPLVWDRTRPRSGDTYEAYWGGVIMEKFTPLRHEGFNLTEDSVEPLRIEGYFRGVYGQWPIWQRPQDQYFAGGKNKKKKLKLAKQWLRDHGLYLKGSEVGCKDANDVHSATLHSLVHMRNIGHVPTLKEWFK